MLGSTAVVVEYNASPELLLHNSPCPLLLASHTTYPISPDDQVVIQLGVRTGLERYSHSLKALAVGFREDLSRQLVNRGNHSSIP
jgi:hypothetical protein